MKNIFTAETQRYDIIIILIFLTLFSRVIHAQGVAGRALHKRHLIFRNVNPIYYRARGFP